MDKDKVFDQMEALDREYPTPASRSGHFYHGTTHDVRDMVRPANVVGKRISGYSEGDPGDMSKGDHAFAVRNDEQYAWHAALNFHRKGGESRPRVYEVEPAPDMKPGPWNKEHQDFQHHIKSGGHGPEVHQDEWASKTGFKVTKQHDIVPGQQGTFPGLNWNQFRGPGHGGYDANHPGDDRIKWGGLGGVPDELDVAKAAPKQPHDWNKDPAPHSELREAAGRPQKRWATLLD